MKAIKLILIFLGIAAVIFGIFIITNRSTASSDDEYIIPAFVKEDCDNIRHLWVEQPGWNGQLYDSLLRVIEQYRANKRYNANEYAEVRNTLREEAVNKARAGYMNALHTSDFDKKRLLEAYEGVKAIEEREHVSNDERIKSVNDRQKLFNDIDKFINSRHTITPRFDSSTMNWKSFDSQRDYYITTARKLKDNRLYSEMNHIPGFATGLDTEKLKKNLDNGRTTFYEELLGQIYHYFKDADKYPQNHNVEPINSVSKKWFEEFHNPNSAKMMGNWTLLTYLIDDYKSNNSN